MALATLPFGHAVLLSVRCWSYHPDRNREGVRPCDLVSKLGHRHSDKTAGGLLAPTIKLSRSMPTVCTEPARSASLTLAGPVVGSSAAADHASAIAPII